jgi:8-oxo-dGTP pyrophosphatase MutT (NUDIX family)
VKTIRTIFEEIKSKYWGNRAAGAFIYSSETGKILWVRRAKKGVKEPGQWTVVVGGKIDENESPRNAVIREVKEELKFNRPFTISAKPAHTFNDEKEDFIYYTFRITVDMEFIPKLNFEHSEHRWLELGEMPKGKIHFGVKNLIQSNII